MHSGVGRLQRNVAGYALVGTWRPRSKDFIGSLPSAKTVERPSKLFQLVPCRNRGFMIMDPQSHRALEGKVDVLKVQASTHCAWLHARTN